MKHPLGNAQPLIALRGVAKSYRQGDLDVPVLHDISLDIFAGEFVAIMGQSGSGKTTLMNLIGCLDRPSAGSYRFDGRDVSGLDADALAGLRRHAFGFIFQRYNLIATETAAENVQVPAVYAGLPHRERMERARQFLVSLGLAERLDYRPTQLSGGQQQRVSIARAVMNGARVILADEPTGALDSKNGAEVLGLLHELHRAGRTIVLITHDQGIAALADRVVQLKDGAIVSDTGPKASAIAAATAVRAPLPEDASESLLPDLMEALKMALRSLRVNMFRTVLTLLGIIIGVGAVVTMLAIGDGSKRSVLARIEAMGTDLLVVRPGARNVRTRDESLALTHEDAVAIGELPSVRAAVPEYSSGVTLRAGNVDYVTSGTGTTAAYARTRNWAASHGAFFSDADVESYAPVAVIGYTVARHLYGAGANPVGEYILVNNIPFQVVGVLAPKGATASGSDMDDAVFMPLSTVRMRLFGRRHVRTITVQAADVAQIGATQAAVEQLLEARHRKVDFQVRNTASLLDAATETQNTLTMLLGSIAAISLLVGGIGVMNIMLVSVTERVREIGVRMASGARRIHILLQFVTEAVLVCCVGGVAGVAGGLASAWVIERLGTPVVYSAGPVLLAFGSAFLIGLVFGYLPARRAARLDPVAALASE